jgi:hypothetical protein
VLRGTTWHLVPSFFIRNVEVGGSSPLTSTPRSAWSWRFVPVTQRLARRGRYGPAVAVGRKRVVQHAFSHVDGVVVRTMERAMTAVSGFVVVGPRCRQVPLDATRCHQTPSARPGLVNNTFLAPRRLEGTAECLSDRTAIAG